MEEILASIRRIIADDDAKPAKGTAMAPETAPPAKQPAAAAPATPPAPPAKPAAPPAPKSATLPAAAANSQDEIDAMLAELDGPPKATPKPAASQSAAPDVLDLTEFDDLVHAAARPGAELPYHRRKFRCRVREQP